jgi:L-aminopeptidase/D-esterase-like protein
MDPEMLPSGKEVNCLRSLLLLCAFAVLAGRVRAEPRGRDLGIPFDFGAPGAHNAITDVPGVEVGHVTLIEGDDVRTGVTAVMPRGRGDDARRPCFAGYYSLNGNGEMTGIAWVEEAGVLDGPVLITNTNAVGVVRDAAIQYAFQRWGGPGGWADAPWSLPVVAETWDGTLNDIYGGHVKAEHARQAIDAARPGPVAEGAVGGGTGMICYEWKGGIGTASRRLTDAAGGFTVGVLVQANFGLRHQARIAGVPVGLELPEGATRTQDSGSIIIVVATDAPLLPHQLKRLARRAALGLARTGSVAGNGSGDLFLAFSTANPRAGEATEKVALEMWPNARMGALFEATVGATEEAIVNALVAGRTMTGYKGHTVPGLPHDRVVELLRRHNRLQPASGR